MRRAAMRPISSGASRRARLRVTWYQESRCISPFAAATGETARLNEDVSYPPAKP